MMCAYCEGRGRDRDRFVKYFNGYNFVVLYAQHKEYQCDKQNEIDMHTKHQKSILLLSF